MRKSNQKKLRKKIDIFSHRKKSKFKKSRSSQSIDVMFFLKNVHDIVWVTQSLSYFENFFFYEIQKLIDLNVFRQILNAFIYFLFYSETFYTNGLHKLFY